MFGRHCQSQRWSSRGRDRHRQRVSPEVTELIKCLYESIRLSVLSVVLYCLDNKPCDCHFLFLIIWQKRVYFVYTWLVSGRIRDKNQDKDLSCQNSAVTIFVPAENQNAYLQQPLSLTGEKNGTGNRYTAQ